jgi:hypothetical protein
MQEEQEPDNFILARLLGYAPRYIKEGSCGGMVYEWVWVKGDHVLQTADWYAEEYSSPAPYSIYYWAMLEAEKESGIVDPKTFTQRKRRRIWDDFWARGEQNPTFAPLEERVKALIYVLQRIPLTNAE